MLRHVPADMSPCFTIFAHISWHRFWTRALFHMAFAFFLLPVLLPLVRLFGRVPEGWSKRFAGVLNSGTGLFNVINALGPHVGGRILSRRALEQVFDRVYRRILVIVNSIPEAEWQRGMYYPWKWDGLFQEYMTLADVCLYPCRHFAAHRADLGTANDELEERMPQGRMQTPD